MLLSTFNAVVFWGWQYIRHSKWWLFLGWHYIRHSKWWPFFGLTLHSSFKVVTFFLGWHYIRDSKLCLLFWADIRFDVQRGDLLSHTRRSRWWQFLADIQRSTWWLYSQHSTFNIVPGTDITFDVQRGVCFWPTFDQLFRHLISTSWVLKAVIREHHTVFRHLTSTSRLWKAVFTTHQT